MTLIFYNASAAEWSINPRIKVGGEYDDNISLSPTNPNEVTSSHATPEVKFSRKDSNSVATIGARAQFNRYSDKDIRDKDVQYLTFDSRYKPQQLTTWRFNGTYARDTTFRTIQNTAVQTDQTDGTVDNVNVDQVDQSVNTDAGLVDVNVRRNRLNLNPSWQRKLTERTSLRLGYVYTDVYYSDAAGTGLVDYRTNTFDTTLSRKMTQKDDVRIDLQLSKYKAPDKDKDTDNYSMNFGYTHDFERDLSSDISVGYRETKIKTDTEESKYNGLVLELGVDKKESKVTTYNVSLKHKINPSGIGRIIQSDQLAFRLRSRLTARLLTTLRVIAFDSSTLAGDVTSADRTYYDIEPGLRWLMTRDWSIEGSYRYRHQKRELDTESAEDNSVYLTLDYSWPKIAVSR